MYEFTNKKERKKKKKVFEILRWDLRRILEMGFDQILRGEVVVVVKLQRFENEKRERKKTEKRKRVREEMTRYEVNGCFFCVKYM